MPDQISVTCDPALHTCAIAGVFSISKSIAYVTSMSTRTYERRLSGMNWSAGREPSNTMVQHTVAVLKLGWQWSIIYRGSGVGSIGKLPSFSGKLAQYIETLRIIVAKALITYWHYQFSAGKYFNGKMFDTSHY